jgi:putative nucleotidyltransferase with HDIG domain
LLAAVLPVFAFESLRDGPLDDPYFIMPEGHFYIVSSVSFLSTLIAIAVGVAGNRSRNIKVIFLSLSFISLAFLLFLHGLSTPHFLFPSKHLPGVSAQLSILLATVWLWFSSLPTDHRLVEKLARGQNILMPAWLAALLMIGSVFIGFPQLIDRIPTRAAAFNGIVTAIVLWLNCFVIRRYYFTYRFARFPLQIAIVYSAVWFIVSQLIVVLGETWRLSWWLYHFLLLASMIVMLIGLLKQYAARGTLAGALRALFTNDPFERVTVSISPSVKALVRATEQKDKYTVGHTFRVAMYSLKLAEELQLKPEQLRAIAQGALVHDVGKISIPDSILNKPGPLTREERQFIERHPVTGYEMCRDLGFMREELNIIRSHHEKWDGSGYPDRLRGEQIDLLARIVAVADVYDALTSERSYRKAWSHQEAIRFLIEQKGKHFDPQCVDAWVNLCRRDPSVYQYPADAINNDTTVSLLLSSRWRSESAK